MPRLLPPVCVLAISFCIAEFAPAQMVVTDPVGFTTTSALSNSDTLISIPFTRPPEFAGAIQSISGNVITVAGSPGWTTNQFVYAAGTQSKHYYVLIGPSIPTNPKEGHAYAVTANGSNTLIVDTTNDNLSGIPASTQVILVPNWTLGTVYPATDEDVSFTATTSTRTFKTLILIPNYGAFGINQSAGAVYFFSHNGASPGWRKVGDADLTTPHDDDPLLPDGYFTVRNSNGAPTLPLTAVGSVLTKKFTVPLATQVSQAQDNAVSMIRPINVRLADTGLNPADNSFVGTTSTRTIKDELFLFNNATAILNKSPSAIYFYSTALGNVGWRKVGDADLTTSHDNDLIPAGSALIVRKAANGTGGTIFWTNSPTY